MTNVTKNAETRSIAELERLNWRDPGPEAAPLWKKCYELINKPLFSLTVADWRTLIAQDIGLNFLVSPAIDVVEKSPLLKTKHFCGDLLVALLGVSSEFFSNHPELKSRLEKVIDSLPTALDQLDFIDFDTSSEALEEAVVEFRKGRTVATTEALTSPPGIMSDFDPAVSRDLSWRQVEHEGLRSSPGLPLLDPDLNVRQSVRAVGTRILCMGAAAACAFGFPLDATRAWIDREGLRDSLSRTEGQFLAGADQNSLFEMKIQVDSLYALAWCASLVGSFSVHGQVPRDLVRCLPDLRNSESSSSFRGRLVLRPKEEILPQLDAAYCFHWAWRDARLSPKRMRVNHEASVGQRRKALEWLMRGGTWDEVSFDT